MGWIGTRKGSVANNNAVGHHARNKARSAAGPAPVWTGLRPFGAETVHRTVSKTPLTPSDRRFVTASATIDLITSTTR